jgi:hypothetical protein
MKPRTLVWSTAVFLLSATLPLPAQQPGSSTGSTVFGSPASFPAADTRVLPAQHWPTQGADVGAPSGPCPGPAGEAAPELFTPLMLGDFIGPPVVNLFSDVKIAEGESPRPMDRVFYRFEYYNNLDQSDAHDLRQPFRHANLYQSVFGMEKTFLDQRISLGVRVPFWTMDVEGKDFLGVDATGAVTLQHGDSFTETEFGDLSAVFKAVVWEDKQSGSLLSAGAVISFPTASSIRLNPGQSLLAYMQPFGGFILQNGDLFVQGFSSITLPLIRPESIVMFNDLGVGYFVYRSDAGILRSVAPTVEVHVATPLRQPDPTVLDAGVLDIFRLHDVVDITAGSTFEFANRATFGVGFVVPVTGPRPFDFEVLAELNYRF